MKCLGYSILMVLVCAMTAAAQPFAYVTNENDRTVLVINTRTNSLMATISKEELDLGQPEGVAVTPDGLYVYVAVRPGMVKVIETQTNTVTSITVGGDPSGVAITPNGKEVYVTNLNSNLSIINTEDKSVIMIPVEWGTWHVAFTPDGTRAYVTGSRVSIIDTESRTVLTTIPVGNFSTGVAVTPDGSYVYVANHLSGTLSIIRTSDNSVMQGEVEVGVAGDLYMIAISPDGKHVYVPKYNSRYLTVVNTGNKETTEIPVGRLAQSVALTPDGSLAYVANYCGSPNNEDDCIDGTVSVIDAANIDTAANPVIETFRISASGLKYIAMMPPVGGPPANHPPIANAGPDQTVSAGPNGQASVTLDGSGSSDPDKDTLTYTWSGAFGTANGANPTVSCGFGTHTVTLTVDDGRGGTAADTVIIKVEDRTPPVIGQVNNLVVNATSSSGAVVTFDLPKVTDNVDPTPTITSVVPASGSLFPIGTTNVTLTASDASGNSSTQTFTVTVNGVTTPGEMRGDGFVVKTGDKYHFNFHVSEGVRHTSRNRFHLRIDYAERMEMDSKGKPKKIKKADDDFVATGINSIAFSDDPAFRPGHARKPQVDTVQFSGVGNWNRTKVCTFEVRATDQGEPGRRRETMAITINCPGNPGVSVSGYLSGGNIQSMRLRH